MNSFVLLSSRGVTVFLFWTLTQQETNTQLYKENLIKYIIYSSFVISEVWPSYINMFKQYNVYSIGFPLEP